MHPRPFLRRLSEARPDLLTFEVLGQLDSHDMRAMADEVAEAFSRQGRIDMLVLFRPFEGATVGAVIEPHALGVELASIAHVRRYGVVGAPKWADGMIKVGRWLTPIEARAFRSDQEATARAWIDRPEA